MPFTGLRIGIAPDVDSFTPALEQIIVRAEDLAPCYDALYGAFRKIEARRFSAEGPGWQELAPSTVANRERAGVGGDHPILNVTAALRKSLTTKGAKNSVVEPIPDGLFMGTADPIAKYHQYGTDKMPARPVVDLNQGNADVFASIVGEWVYGTVMGLGQGGITDSGLSTVMGEFTATAGAI